MKKISNIQLNKDKSHFTNTTKHILYLHKNGYTGYDIVKIIADNWDMSLIRASIIVEHAYKKFNLQGSE